MSIKFSKSHEWVLIDGDTATIGITDFAQQQLGDVVFIDLPAEGASLEKGAECAVVESVKAASEVYCPVSGTVTDVNSLLEDTPETVNTAPEGDGWFFKMTLSDTSELDALMDQAAYDAMIKD